MATGSLPLGIPVKTDPPSAEGKLELVKAFQDATAAFDSSALCDQVTAPFHLPAKLVHLVLVNGHYIAPAERATRPLAPDDVLAIWPPIAGG